MKISHYHKVYRYCRERVQEGTLPTPTMINNRFHPHRVKCNNINGDETKARTAALKDYGAEKNEKTGRWKLK